MVWTPASTFTGSSWPSPAPPPPASSAHSSRIMVTNSGRSARADASASTSRAGTDALHTTPGLRLAKKAKYMGEPAALKQFTLSAGGEWKRLRQELLMYAKLRHPCVAEVKAAFMDKANGYIHFTLYERDLHAWMADPPTNLCAESVIRMFVLMLTGMYHIHASGFIHGDISTKNVVMSSDGVPVYIDFELARTTTPRDSCPVTALAGGTAAFTAPELQREGLRDPHACATLASDVYALGTVLLQLLQLRQIQALKLPFQLLALTHDMTCQVPGDRVTAAKALQRLEEVERGARQTARLRALEEQAEQIEKREAELSRKVAEGARKIAARELEDARKQLKCEADKRAALARELQLSELRPPNHWGNMEGPVLVRRDDPTFAALATCFGGGNIRWAWSIQDRTQWRKYAASRAQVREQLGTSPPDPEVMVSLGNLPGELELGVNERWLLHGTGTEAVDSIIREGFNERFARDRGIYGAGNYFAEDAEKCYHYARAAQAPLGLRLKLGLGDEAVRFVFVSRCVLGWFVRVRWVDNQLVSEDGGPVFAPGSGRRELAVNPSLRPHRFHSILAPFGKSKHREFVVYDGTQAYPEYLVALR
eukprot:Hpha_TRINITY_DN15495_c2_g2::TRINITY_DN15495_c2_g2_i1::g.173840::m.173840